MFAWWALNTEWAWSTNLVFPANFEASLQNLPPSRLASYRKHSLDPLLGWDVTKGSTGTTRNRAGVEWTETVEKTGVRRNPSSYLTSLISAYGDSFTYGHEVNDDQTWPFYLSELTQTSVVNYGTGGYGADQTLLKLQRNIEKGNRTPIVIFSFYMPALERLLSAYRPFHYRKPRATFEFKPMLIQKGQDLQWRKSPLQKLDNHQDLLAALQEAKTYDGWYRKKKVMTSFPHLLKFLQLCYYSWMSPDVNRVEFLQNPEIKSRLLFLLSHFRSHSQKHHYVPVLLPIPSAIELRTRNKPGGKCEGSGLMEELQKSGTFKNFVMVDLCKKKFDERKFFIQEFEGHPSSYGNRMIAESVYDQLHNILQEQIQPASRSTIRQ